VFAPHLVAKSAADTHRINFMVQLACLPSQLALFLSSLFIPDIFPAFVMHNALLTRYFSARQSWYSRPLTILSTGLLLGACSASRPATVAAVTLPAPVDQALFATIARQDSLMFVAFNRHDLAQLQTFFAEDLEFYHDKGGLANYAQNLEGFRRMFEQNQTTGLNRQLVPGTMEVYPIKDYGAVETYQHRFCHQENGKADCGTFKNMMVWRLKDGQWKVTRVVSYGH
jgi:hypothetical protein